ncbi:unnamed protein product [Heligmosomoides polygyrus]|uniref:Transferred entry: 7.1.1.2 n=1 Tax=Heligmosomoides polygyrus TaxID=6339 RepID=A0A183FHM3_HELPZ|nr:unnamed protein product [Heligmosomoides polygyrus]
MGGVLQGTPERGVPSSGGRERTTNGRTIPPWTQEEVRKAIGKMKLGKAAGPDGVPVEAWKVLGDLGIESSSTIFNYRANVCFVGTYQDF